MKKLCILLLTLCLLVGMLSVYASAAEATDSLASNYLSSDMQAKLKEKTSYDRVIKVYTLGMYFHDLVEGDTWEELISEAFDEMYFVKNDQSIESEKMDAYIYDNNAFHDYDGTPILEKNIYAWIADEIEASYLRIVGIGQKEIQNMYCVITNSPPMYGTIVYDTGDAHYYAVYNNGRTKDPTYFTEEGFEAYVYAWVNEYNNIPQYDENGLALDGALNVSISTAPFHPLTVSLSAVAMENPDELLTEPVTETAEGTDEVMTDAPTDSGCAAVSYGTVGLCLLTLAIALPCLEKKKIKR